MRIVIIGNGITGITAAINIRKQAETASITVISSESDYFYSRTALMYLYLGHMTYQHLKPYEDWFWHENKIDLLRGTVVKVDFRQKQVLLQDQTFIAYDKLLIATGSVPNKLQVPGEKLSGIQGFYHLNDLQLLEANTNNINQAVIIGGGLIGVELAEMLFSRCIPVTFIIREKNYWDKILPPEEATLIENHIRQHGIELKMETQVKEFQGDQHQKLNAVITSSEEIIPCAFAGVAVGVSPNINFLKNTELDTNRGVLVNQYLETNIADVYAAGDCAELKREKTDHTVLEQVWYTGRMQGETVAKNMLEQRTPYEPGIWFNSAKFFDIEYQTYGTVLNKIGKSEKTFFWQHPRENKCLRINFKAATQEVLGFNLLGIRYRHEVCNRWISERRTIAYVMQHLAEANFDPEFYRRHEKAIQKKFAEQKPGYFTLS